MQLVLAVSIFLSFVTIYAIHSYKQQLMHSAIHSSSGSYVTRIESNINQALSATFPLATLIRIQQGDTAGFTQLATEMLPFYPSVSALQLAPDGIVQYVVPLAGNENAIGHNILAS